MNCTQRKPTGITRKIRAAGVAHSCILLMLWGGGCAYAGNDGYGDTGDAAATPSDGALPDRFGVVDASAVSDDAPDLVDAASLPDARPIPALPDATPFCDINAVVDSCSAVDLTDSSLPLCPGVYTGNTCDGTDAFEPSCGTAGTGDLAVPLRQGVTMETCPTYSFSVTPGFVYSLPLNIDLMGCPGTEIACGGRYCLSGGCGGTHLLVIEKSDGGCGEFELTVDWSGI